ncbi:MAG: hypothetical protein CLLPBCKN_006210 [Chroococcidiopsis cubana SAG 39.79]|nr:hypothetical protein [Chroococcidiopsis cubana SAG 39.79]
MESVMGAADESLIRFPSFLHSFLHSTVASAPYRFSLQRVAELE